MIETVNPEGLRASDPSGKFGDVVQRTDCVSVRTDEEQLSLTAGQRRFEVERFRHRAAVRLDEFGGTRENFRIGSLPALTLRLSEHMRRDQDDVVRLRTVPQSGRCCHTAKRMGDNRIDGRFTWQA